MWLATLILLQIPAATDVTVQPLSGAEQVGSLLELNGTRVSINVEGEKQSFDVQDLLALVVRTEEPSVDPVPGIYVELVDGSLMIAQGYRVANRMAQIQLHERTIPVQTRNIRSVRLRTPTAPLEEQWREILGAENRGDVIVLRRSATALDQLEGVFHDITDETVEFEYDDQRIPVKRTKLEGIVYYHPVGRKLPDTVCTVHELGGTHWHARSIELRQDRLDVVTTCGTKCSIPWKAVARFDFSSSNIAYLSDLDFELAECTPYIASRISPERILQLYAPRRNEGFEGDRLWLPGDMGDQYFDKGLAIHSRSRLVFRLAEPYRRFAALVGIDSRQQGRGDLELIIEGDNKELFRRNISGKDPPFDLDVNIQGVRRLTILVDFGKSLDVADHLNLCNARVIK